MMKEINHNNQPVRQIKTEQSGNILHDFLNNISRGCRPTESELKEAFEQKAKESKLSPGYTINNDEEYYRQEEEINKFKKDYLSAEEYDNMTPEQESEYYKTGYVPDVEEINYMQVIPDSHFYTSLEMILQNLKMLSIGYKERDKPNYGEYIYVEWPPVSIEHLVKGLENTINNGYKLVKDGK